MKNTICLLLALALAGCSKTTAPVAVPPPTALPPTALPPTALPPTALPPTAPGPTAPGPTAAADATAPTDATVAPPTANQTETLIIDVRSQEEWDSGHLPQAVHIPHTEIAEKIGEHTSDKNAKIVLYCKAGGRAGKAQQTLQDLGFVDVENAGGFDDIKKRFE